jgi:hypothetical protein
MNDKSDPDRDGLLEPRAHAKALPAEAGALARLLEQDEIVQAAWRYKKADSAALGAQQRYKTLNLVAIWFRFLAIAIGLLAIIPTGLKLQYLAERAQAADRWVVALQFLALASALAFGFTVEKLKLFRRWMAFRAKAEHIRQKYFDLIMSARERPSKGETALLPLKLDYFTRHHLVVQRDYYRRRGREHKRKAWQTGRAMSWMKWLGILSLLPVLWVILEALGIIALETGDIDKSFLALGTIAAVVLGALDTISKANLDARNAARYAIVTANLEFLEKQELPKAQEAAAEGKHAAVRDFITLVNREIALEHREWRLLRDEFHRQAASNAPPEA